MSFSIEKNAEKNESVAKKVNLQWIYVYLMENDGFLWEHRVVVKVWFALL